MEKSQIPSPEPLDSKKNKKEKKKDDEKSRFERLQESLQRAIETLLSGDDSERRSTSKDEKSKDKSDETKADKVEADQVGSDGEDAVQTERQPGPDLEQIAASLELSHPSSSTHERDEAAVGSIEQVPADDETEAERTLRDTIEALLDVTENETDYSHVETDTDDAADERRAEANSRWQQARSRVREFIDRHRPSAESDLLAEDAEAPESGSEELEAAHPDMTVAELESYYGKSSDSNQESRPANANDSISPTAAAYVAFNELRQRRYRKKLERIAKDQREQRRELDQAVKEAERANIDDTSLRAKVATQTVRRKSAATTKPEKSFVSDKLERKPELTKPQPSVVPEQREGEVRLDYPPLPKDEQQEQSEIKKAAKAETTPPLASEETEVERYRQPRSQPAQSIGEIIERRSSSPEQLEYTEHENNFERAEPHDTDDRARAGTATASVMTTRKDQDDLDSRQPLVPSQAAALSRKQSDSAAAKSSSSTADVALWQKVLLVVINFVLIALLVRELVF